MKDSLSIDEIVDGLYKLQQEKNNRIFLQAVKEALKAQADQYEKEKEEMVREMNQRMLLSRPTQKLFETIAQKYGVDLSE